eukprot:m51a1_g12936 hypothetical protein (76) ;mRNA; r:1587-1814
MRNDCVLAAVCALLLGMVRVCEGVGTDPSERRALCALQRSLHKVPWSEDHCITIADYCQSNGIACDNSDDHVERL